MSTCGRGGVGVDDGEGQISFFDFGPCVGGGRRAWESEFVRRLSSEDVVWRPFVVGGQFVSAFVVGGCCDKECDTDRRGGAVILLS